MYNEGVVNHRTITVQPFYLHYLFFSKLMVVIAISDCVHQVFVLLKEKPNNIKTLLSTMVDSLCFLYLFMYTGAQHDFYVR
jgi:hypothetical protein